MLFEASIGTTDIGLGSSKKGNVGPASKPKKKSMTAPDGKNQRCIISKQKYFIATATGNLGRHCNHRHPGYDWQGDILTQAPHPSP
ncbi:hypothetical protein AMTR_s00010p00263830 [Amborella trichopoda]|uniref:Uncharacterized protein n=1 Tax=Amborella trichopoda TaxID=13333 RepID=W1NG95_AMBTC|nr:hypothetical protein AMTR_s00010p00263830 [Amborella trichopoda]